MGDLGLEAAIGELHQEGIATSNLLDRAQELATG